MATGDPRLKQVSIDALVDPERELVVSAVVAFELTDLQMRGRVAMTESLDILQSQFGFAIADLPAGCWKIAQTLPEIHGDPVDRMLVAHSIIAGMTLATADANIRRYPVALI